MSAKNWRAAVRAALQARTVYDGPPSSAIIHELRASIGELKASIGELKASARVSSITNDELRAHIVKVEAASAASIAKVEATATSDARIWGADYIRRIAGEFSCWLVKKQPKPSRPSKAFGSLEVSAKVQAVAEILKISPVDFCRLAERVMDSRNMAVHFQTKAGLGQAVEHCLTLFENHPELKRLHDDQAKILVHFEKICTAFEIKDDDTFVE